MAEQTEEDQSEAQETLEFYTANISGLTEELQQLKGELSQFGPVTMIVPACGHQVRCIPLVQMGTFNKEIGFLCGLKFFALNIFCGEYLQSSLHMMLQIW